MAVSKRGDTWHVAFRYKDPVTGQPQRFRRTTGPNTTKREAEALERAWRAEVESPPKPVELERKQAAFSGYAKHWLELKRPDWKPNYYRSVEQSIRCHIVPHFGDRDLRRIGPEDVQAYKASRLKVLKPQTVNNHKVLLSTMFKDAMAWGYCERNPAHGISRLKPQLQNFKFWTKEDTAKFLGHVQVSDPEWHPLFLMALRTGLRAGEVFGLDWQDVDLKRQVVRVRQNWSKDGLGTPKSGKPRDVPLTDDLVAVLKTVPREGEIVFPYRQDGPGARLDANKVKTVFWRCTAEAGVPRIRFHDLRHSFASQLVMAGIPMKGVQELLGHADMVTTQRYAHLAPGVKTDYVKVLEE